MTLCRARKMTVVYALELLYARDTMYSANRLMYSMLRGPFCSQLAFWAA
jgi:hypothetical protein